MQIDLYFVYRHSYLTYSCVFFNGRELFVLVGIDFDTECLVIRSKWPFKYSATMRRHFKAKTGEMPRKYIYLQNSQVNGRLCWA